MTEWKTGVRRLIGSGVIDSVERLNAYIAANPPPAALTKPEYSALWWLARGYGISSWWPRRCHA